MGDTQSEITMKFFNEGLLVTAKAIRALPKDFDFNGFVSLMDMKFKKRPLTVNEDVVGFVLNGLGGEGVEINWSGFDEAKVVREKHDDGEMYKAFLDILDYNSNPGDGKVEKLLKSMGEDNITPGKVDGLVEQENCLGDGGDAPLIVLDSYDDAGKARDVQDFVNYFKARYNQIKEMICHRQSMNNVTSINRVLNKFEKEGVSIIGIVNEKRLTKNGNIIVNLEDLSGSINVLINKNRKGLFDEAKNLILDEVIGVNGSCSPGFGGGSLIFCDELVMPEIPLDHEFKKLDREVYAVFTSDLHFGNKMFCGEEILRFVDWINGERGTKEQMETAKKVKYLFVVGDLVDGIGVYPNQDKDLVIKDIYEQYKQLANILGQIRKDVKIVLLGGNHDALRMAEPQPVLDRKLAAPLYELPNVVMVNNPGWVNIGASSSFDGFNVLLYHGFSFPAIAEDIDEIRLNGGVKRPDLIMKELLRRRHLAPPHTATLYVPDNKEDYLVIKRIPDFFISGHIHKTVAMNYRNVSLIGAGCWIKQTEDQKKRGIVPDPARIAMVNLQTREIKLLYFGDD